MSNRVIIQIQSPGGVWSHFSSCQNHAPIIRQLFLSALKGNDWAVKVRAIDEDTKQLVDMDIRS